MAGGIAHQWNSWGIQILVLLSFVFQVVLLFFAGIRRRRAHAVLRLLLWLMYLLADSTAIYSVGHLSFTSRSREHQLVAFWAPFLLVHLGGSDSITAYSLEDNRLWLRHLFTLAVQVMGAAFVIYKYVFGTETLLLLAATMMFIVGVLKYGERTWALKCGNMDSIRMTVETSMEDDYRSIFNLQFPFPNGRENMSEEEFLLAAHSLFHMCKSLFTDLSIMISGFKLCSIGVHTKKSKRDLYKLVELELSLMYDILYTKAAVIHTWYGCCIRVVSLLGTVTAALLFQFSDKFGYNVVDVAITYVLVVGALVLEIISVLKAAGSTWTCAMLYCLGSGWLLDVLKCLRRCVRAASKRRWSGSIGQFNMFHLCTRDTTEIGSRVTSMVGLKEKWNNMHFANTTSLTPDLKDLLLETLPKIDVRGSRGTQILENRKFDKGLAEWSYWSVSTNFDESILVWHIATEVYLRKSKSKHAIGLAGAIQVLSNYMMYLLVAKPDMLPGPTRQSQYVHNCNILDQLWRRIRSEPSRENHNNPVMVLKKLFCHDGPNVSTIPKREQLIEKMLNIFRGFPEQKTSTNGLATELKSLDATIDGSACIYGLTLAEELLRMEPKRSDLLEVIFEVWVQMMCYAANHCSRDSHARRLNSGGEFSTIVWLLTQHILMQPQMKNQSGVNILMQPQMKNQSGVNILMQPQMKNQSGVLATANEQA